VRRARLLGSRDSAACSLGGKLIVQAIWYGSTRTPFTWDFFHELVTKAAYDGVLDCRVLLSRHDAAVVVTIFAGWPARRRRDHPWDEAAGFRPGDDVIGARRAEDRSAPPTPCGCRFSVSFSGGEEDLLAIGRRGFAAACRMRRGGAERCSPAPRAGVSAPRRCWRAGRAPVGAQRPAGRASRCGSCLHMSCLHI
jgi:hypothetical protein